MRTLERLVTATALAGLVLALPACKDDAKPAAAPAATPQRVNPEPAPGAAPAAAKPGLVATPVSAGAIPPAATPPGGAPPPTAPPTAPPNAPPAAPPSAPPAATPPPAVKSEPPAAPPRIPGREELVELTPELLKEYTKDLTGTGKLIATIETDYGTLTCELFDDKAPKTVANFVGLARGLREFTDSKTGQKAKRAYFDGTECHRVIPNFMSQCGDPTATGRGGPGYRFADEFHPDLKHDAGGTMSMANAGPSTNGSQFFITEGPTPHLDNRHAVFGRCAPVDLIKTINRVPKKADDPTRSRPEKPVILKKVTITRR